MIPLELGQVSDPNARRALEQLSLHVSPATFLVGTGAPTALIGGAGAVYLDTATRKFYGPKTGGAWPATPIGTLGP